MAKAKLTVEQRAEAVKRYKGGESSTKVAAEFGVSRTLIYRWAGGLSPEERKGRQAEGAARMRQRAAEVARPWGMHPERAAARIQRHYLTAGDAASELGISRFTMNEYLHAGKFPGAFQIGEKGRFWLVPRASVEARKAMREVRNDA